MDDATRREFDETDMNAQAILDAGFVEAGEDGSILEDSFEGDIDDFDDDI